MHKILVLGMLILIGIYTAQIKDKMNTVVLNQTARITYLEDKIKQSNQILHEKVTEIDKREQLLVITAEKLQAAIDDLAQATKQVDCLQAKNRTLQEKIKTLEEQITDLEQARNSV